MKTPGPRKIAVLLAIAALLAALTMGNISICDVIIGVAEQADTLRVSVQAGQIVEDIKDNDFEAYMFRLCPPGAISGVYPVTRFLGTLTPGEFYRIVDLVTSTTSPPGHYVINYTESLIAHIPFGEVPVLTHGVLDLTITPRSELLHSCFYSQVEIIQVGVPATFNAACSTGPIVQYKWWFNYNNSPASPPSTTTTGATAQTTYGSAGLRTVRLVVRTAGGEEAEATHVINVSPPYAVQGAP